MGAVHGAVPHHHAKAHALALALVLLALVQPRRAR